MSKYFAHIVFDPEDSSFGWAGSGTTDAMIHAQPSAAQKGMPFSEVDLQELATMNSHHDNL